MPKAVPPASPRHLNLGISRRFCGAVLASTCRGLPFFCNTTVGLWKSFVMLPVGHWSPGRARKPILAQKHRATTSLGQSKVQGTNSPTACPSNSIQSSGGSSPLLKRPFRRCHHLNGGGPSLPPRDGCDDPRAFKSHCEEGILRVRGREHPKHQNTNVAVKSLEPFFAFRNLMKVAGKPWILLELVELIS